MQATAVPTKIQVPFANSGAKNTIPIPSQISTSPGAASFTDGFPPATRTPLVSGGVPPSGQDFNGILNAITAIQQWQCAGGLFKFDSAFATAIGGYPKGAELGSSTGMRNWFNTVDGNTTDPDSAQASGWTSTLGSLAGSDNAFTNIAGAVAIPASDVGKVIPLGGSSAQTVTLPSTAGLPDGASLTLYNQNSASGGASYTLSAQAGQNVIISTGFAQTTSLVPGDIVTLTVYNGNWAMTTGVTGISLSRMPAFAASKATGGYQKLPSGVLIQWGSVVTNSNGTASVTFPVAFPTGAFQAYAVGVASSPQAYIAVVGVLTSTGMTVSTSNGAGGAIAVGASWFALGN